MQSCEKKLKILLVEKFVMHDNINKEYQSLVTLLTPCYNTGSLIHRLLDSVLEQTYPHIEMIVIDDGSTDNSAEVIKSYIPRFQSKGYKLKYVYQNNEGQSSAIKHGLKFVNGVFLAWPDSDDWYASNRAIEKMVLRLIQSPAEFAAVRCQQRLVDEVTLDEISIDGYDAKEEEELDLFDDCLFFQNGFYIQPISYMVKTSILRETTNFDIYTNKNAGQNWQLLLPILYSFRCMTIKEILTNILNRSTSHSRGQYNGYNDLIIKSKCFELVAVETINRIKSMPTDIKKRYIEKIRLNSLRERMSAAYVHRNRKDYMSLYHEWCASSKDALLLGNRIVYYVVKIHLERTFDFFNRLLKK